MLLLIAIHTDLVATDDSLQTVLLAELLGDVGSELHTHATLAGTAAGLRLRVGPEHLHHETGLTRLSLLVSVKLPDVI